MRSKIVAVCLVAAVTAFGHVKDKPSVHDTVDGILQRMKKLPVQQIVSMNRANVLALLSAEERHTLSTGHIQFTVDQPVELYLAVDPGLRAPFWLADQGFVRTGWALNSSRDGKYEIWKKTSDKKTIELGVNSVEGGGKHYLIFVKGQKRPAVKVTAMYPGQARAVAAENGVDVYVDRSGKLEQLPAELAGATFIQTMRNRQNDGQLLSVLLTTEYPSSPMPDQVVLSWVLDPRTTQTVTWRTDTTVTDATLFYQEKRFVHSFSTKTPATVKAQTTRLVNHDIINDPVNLRHSVTVTDLKPATTYVYSVGDAAGRNATAWQEFTTAPSATEPFSFMYIGDAQNGLNRWGSLMHTAHRMRPDVSFILMAGDLVNRGAQRDDWDMLFANAVENYATKPLMPAIGNHEYQSGFPKLYLDLLTLPTNGPKTIEPERAYSFQYSNSLFVVLDSNRDFVEQKEWLEGVLKNSTATWKFVMFHHPAYSSAPNRNNTDVLSEWVPLFDTYHVDMVLQGHDHAYLRTYPMHNNKVVDSTAKGTVYVVSVSGVKMYEQGDFAYTAKGFTNTATFQILDILVTGNRLLYKSYDEEGDLVDEIQINK